ncbi:MAG: type II toxin-antitoxin system VapC family toxin [Candidatus Dormibacteria bacterium]
MRLLLDTHVLLWWLAGSRKLPPSVREVIADESSDIWVSAASAWEIAIKKSLGKLSAPDDLLDQLDDNGFESLPILVADALEAGALPPHHDDPFDRMLVAQARLSGLTLVTGDARMAAYDVLRMDAGAQ